jgi:hypothetical protein
MYRGTNEITNKNLGFKITNSMSYGEFVIYARPIQKIVKVDLHVRVNYAILPRNQCGKVLEDSRGLHTKVGLEWLPCGIGQPHLQATRPLWAPPVILVAMSVSHCLLGCISSIA